MSIRGAAIIALIWATPLLADELPSRTINMAYATTATLADVQSCLTQWADPLGDVEPQPNGDLVIVPVSWLGIKGRPVLTVTIADGDGDERRVSMLYSHPMSGKVAAKLLRNGAEKCGLAAL